MNKLIFDKALEIARCAALDELENNHGRADSTFDANRCMLAYETASGLLCGLLDSPNEKEEDGGVAAAVLGSSAELGEAAIATIEKCECIQSFQRFDWFDAVADAYACPLRCRLTHSLELHQQALDGLATRRRRSILISGMRSDTSSSKVLPEPERVAPLIHAHPTPITSATVAPPLVIPIMYNVPTSCLAHVTRIHR